jgi:cytochrome c553
VAGFSHSVYDSGIPEETAMIEATKILCLVLSLTFANLNFAASKAPAPPGKTDDKAQKPLWSQKMQELSQSMGDLLPEITSSRPTTSPAAIKKLKAASKRIKDLAHTINMGPNSMTSPLPPDADPSIPFLSSLFEREAKHAYSALESGQVEYAKGSLRIVTSYCIACHTRTDKGPNFPSLPIGKTAEKMPKFEKAQLYAATRQFDKAFQEFEGIITDAKFAKERQLEWGRAVRQAFTIAVRVKQDPQLALGIVKKVEGLKSTPALFREYVGAWRKSIEQWQQEKSKTFATEAELFAEAQRLLKIAQGMQKYPLDHSADILFLRISLLAHEMLSRYPAGQHTSDALFLAGNSYDLLDDHLISPLPEMYYEACIRRSPNTSVSQACFQKYEANVNFGYTGSAGTSIPDDLQALLKELKKLSTPKAKAAGEPS